MKIELQEVPKSYSNNTDNNNTEYSDTDFSKTDISDTEDYLSYLSYAAGKTKEDTMDEIERMNAYRTLIRCYRAHYNKLIFHFSGKIKEVLA